MTRRLRPSDWIAIGLLVSSLAMILFAFASLFLPGRSALSSAPDLPIFVGACSIFVALPSVGAILAIRRSANPIGWLFLVCGIGFIIGVFSSEYVGRTIVSGASLPLHAFVDWAGAWSWTLSISLAVIWIPMLFPDGHLAGTRWRPLAWAGAILVVTGTLAQAILPDAADGWSGQCQSGCRPRSDRGCRGRPGRPLLRHWSSWVCCRWPHSSFGSVGPTTSSANN